MKSFLEKIFKIIERITPDDDKLKHNFVGDYFYLIVLTILIFFISIIWSVIIAFVLTVLLGIGRELYNKHYEKKKFDWYDVFHTAIKSLIYSIIILILTKINTL